MRRLSVLYISLVLVGAAQLKPSAVVAELNYARREPQAYAGVIQQWTSYFKGRVLALPGITALMTHEGAPAVWEAVRALRATRSIWCDHGFTSPPHTPACNRSDRWRK